MKEQELYKKAIEKWGKEAQIFMAVEEMAELTKELSKAYRGKSEINKIIEEITDVEIMLEQLKVLFEIKDVDSIERKLEKLDRLKDLVSER